MNLEYPEISQLAADWDAETKRRVLAWMAGSLADDVGVPTTVLLLNRLADGLSEANDDFGRRIRH